MSIRVSFCIALIFLCSGLALAQQNVTSATLSGSIHDASGAVVHGANITAKNIETNQRVTATSDSEGRYRFPYLRTGDYDLTIEAQGFAIRYAPIYAFDRPGARSAGRLEVAGVAAQVNIGSDVPMIETVRTQITETIRPREINELPLNGRNYLDLATLIPGVSPTNTGSNQRFAETSAVPGQGISIAGQRNLYNSFIVDGVSANDDAADLTGTLLQRGSDRSVSGRNFGRNCRIWPRFRRRGQHPDALRNERFSRQYLWLLPQPALRRSQPGRPDERPVDARCSTGPRLPVPCVANAPSFSPISNRRGETIRP